MKATSVFLDDVYPGKQETETSTLTQTYLLMNWGWDGSYDSGEYSTGINDKWTASSYDFQYKKKIYYNFK